MNCFACCSSVHICFRSFFWCNLHQPGLQYSSPKKTRFSKRDCKKKINAVFYCTSAATKCNVISGVYIFRVQKTLDFWRQKVRFEGEISNEKLRLTLKCKLFDKVLEALRSQMTIIITSQWWHKTSEKWLPVILPGNHHHFLRFSTSAATHITREMLYSPTRICCLFHHKPTTWEKLAKNKRAVISRLSTCLAKVSSPCVLELHFFSRLSSILIEDPTLTSFS